MMKFFFFYGIRFIWWWLLACHFFAVFFLLFVADNSVSMLLFFYFCCNLMALIFGKNTFARPFYAKLLPMYQFSVSAKYVCLISNANSFVDDSEKHTCCTSLLRNDGSTSYRHSTNAFVRLNICPLIILTNILVPISGACTYMPFCIPE